MDDFQDLRIEKLLAFCGRVEPRDAVDLYFILHGSTISGLLDQAKRKDPGFDLYWFAIALNRVESFPVEIERWPVKLVKPVEAQEIKNSFLKLAQKIMSDITSNRQKGH